MNFKVQRRKGIGNVITTLIVLIASVVLGAGVIFFGGSLFQTNTQQEGIQVTNANLWVNSTNAQGAFVVKNIGSKAIAVNSIEVRGTQIPYTSWYTLTDQAFLGVSANVQTPLQYDPDGNYASISINGVNKVFTQAAGPVALKQGESAIIWLDEPASLGATDSGIAYSMNVKAGSISAVSSVSVING